MIFFISRYHRTEQSLLIPNFSKADAGHLCCEITAHTNGYNSDKQCSYVHFIGMGYHTDRQLVKKLFLVKPYPVVYKLFPTSSRHSIYSYLSWNYIICLISCTQYVTYRLFVLSNPCRKISFHTTA